MSWRHLRKLSDITDIRVVSVLLPSGDQLAVSFYVWTGWTLKDIQKDSKHLKTRLCWPSLHISCFSFFVAKIEMHFWRSKTLAKQQRCIAQVAPLEHPSWPVPCQDMSSRTQAPCWWLNIRKCWMKNAWTTYSNAIGGNQTRTELIVGKVKSHVNPANFANHFTKVFGSLVDFLVFSVSTESTGPLLVYPLVMCSRYWATQWPKHQVAAIRCCILEFGHSQGSKAIILINLLYAIFNTKPVYVPRYLCDLRVSIYKISNGGKKKELSCTKYMEIWSGWNPLWHLHQQFGNARKFNTLLSSGWLSIPQKTSCNTCPYMMFFAQSKENKTTNQHSKFVAIQYCVDGITGWWSEHTSSTRSVK